MPRFAVIKGDGIGPEVVDEALKVLDAVELTFAPNVEIEMLPYGADHYLATGETLPVAEMIRLGIEFDAILLGAVGDPRIPGSEHARDILLGMRSQLDLYVNERPVRLYADQLTPLKRLRAGQIDITVLRENTEGLYVGVGGDVRRGTRDEIAIAEEVHTRRGIERFLRHAFEWARMNGRSRVTLADMSHAIPAHMLWRRLFDEVGRDFPEVRRDARHVDALAMELVRAPETFEVIVAANLYGDILADVAAALVGGHGVAPSANRHPGRVSLFEPVHGSAPALARSDRANPLAAILSLAMMLSHIGETDASAAVENTVRASIVAGVSTPDLGGQYGTRAVGDWVAGRVRALG